MVSDNWCCCEVAVWFERSLWSGSPRRNATGWSTWCGLAGVRPGLRHGPRILLKTSEGWSAPRVAQALDVAESSVYRIKRRFSEDGLDGVLQDRPQANRHHKLEERAGAHLIALACTPAPEGHEHWTLRALAGRVVELGLVTSLSHESVRRHLKKTPSSRGRKSSGAFPR